MSCDPQEFKVNQTWHFLIHHGFVGLSGAMELHISVRIQIHAASATPRPSAEFRARPPVVSTEAAGPYTGLHNMGVTFYLNSVLQSLFHLPSFRHFVYEMDPQSDNIAFNLQQLFAQMQLSIRPCSTRSLMDSFEWGNPELFMKHDVQEFYCVLLTNLAGKSNIGLPNFSVSEHADSSDAPLCISTLFGLKNLTIFF
jgi:ubiquitin C-terminal hydrolase